MRGDQLARQWRLILMLEARRFGATVEEMAADLNTSIRTVYRDLEVLQSVGVPLESERDGGQAVWRMVDAGRWKLGITLHFTEVVALVVAARTLSQQGGGHWSDRLTSAVEKIQSAVPGRDVERMAEHLLTVSASDRGGHDYESRRDLLAEVTRALFERRPLEITYASPQHQEERSRRIHPYQMHLHEGALYLIGHDSLHDEVRTFLVDRIRLASVGEGRFEVPEEFNLEAYLSEAFAVWRGGEPIELTVRIDGPMSRLPLERRWHPSQETEPAGKQSVRVTMQVPDTPELRTWLRSFGSALVVESPESLAASMVREAEAVLLRYGRRAQAPVSGAGKGSGRP